MTISHLKKAPIIKTVRFNFRSVSGSIRRLCTFLHLDNLAENTPHSTAVLSNAFAIHDKILSLCNWILSLHFKSWRLHKNIVFERENCRIPLAEIYPILDTHGFSYSVSVPRRLWHGRWNSYCYFLFNQRFRCVLTGGGGGVEPVRPTLYLMCDL